MTRRALHLLLLLCLLSVCLCPVWAQAETETASVPERSNLVIYTPHERGPAITSIKEFQETTGIPVDVVFAGTGELIDRIREELSEGRSSCDVLWGGGAESIAANVDLFSPYVSSVDALIAPQDKDASALWIGESPVPVVIMYNTALVSKEEAPERWSDLLDAKWKGRIAFADPAKSGSAYSILCTMRIALGNWDAIAAFAKNLDGKQMESSASVYQSVADGQYSIALTQEKVAQGLIRDGKKVAIAYPLEGTSAVDDAIALVKQARNSEAAKQFIEFVLAEPNQKMMANLYNRRPVRTDLDPPSGLPEMRQIPLVSYDLRWASGNKSEILARWNTMLQQN